MSRRIARQVMSVMAGCGMYDGAGEWLTTVGIPAKSGVAGGLLGTLPGQCGIAVFSPRLDEHGNSTRGVLAFRRLSTDMNMHMVDAEPYGTTVLRDPNLRRFDDLRTAGSHPVQWRRVRPRQFGRRRNRHPHCGFRRQSGQPLR